MNFLRAQLRKNDTTTTAMRFVGLSSCCANAVDLGQWLGCSSRTGVHAFDPNVNRRTFFPTKVVLKTYDGREPQGRFQAMGRPTWDCVKDCLQSKSQKKSSSQSSNASEGAEGAEGAEVHRHHHRACLIFVPSASQCQTTAIDMITHAMATKQTEVLLRGSGLNTLASRNRAAYLESFVTLVGFLFFLSSFFLSLHLLSARICVHLKKKKGFVPVSLKEKIKKPNFERVECFQFVYY